MGTIDQIRRMIILRHYLHSKPGAGTREIAKAMGISPQMLDHDLELLRKADKGVDSIAGVVELDSEIRLGEVRPDEAAVLLAVCRHEQFPRRGTAYAKVWNAARRRLVEAIAIATKPFKPDVEKHLRAILKSTEPLASTSRTPKVTVAMGASKRKRRSSRAKKSSASNTSRR